MTFLRLFFDGSRVFGRGRRFNGGDKKQGEDP